MNQFILLLIGIICLIIGSVLGYYTRQSIAKKRKGTIEAIIEKKIVEAKKEAQEIINRSRQKSEEIISQTQKEIDETRKRLLKSEEILFKREQGLEKKISIFERKEKEFFQKLKKLRIIKERIEKTRIDLIKKIEKLAGFSAKEAKEELFKEVEKNYQKELIDRLKILQEEGEKKLKRKALEILSLAIEKYALPQTYDITTTIITLPSEEIKGRIIGKEGRNIKAFEKVTGVELIVDETPEIVTISAFNPVRRQIAKMALIRLIEDGRIQPSRIEEEVERAKKEIENQIEEFGTNAVYETGIVDLSPKLVKLLGRLYFRTSYGQNVLQHSLEVAFLSAVLAQELGANVKITKKAGLLHDIGKAIDREIEGSHIEIGIKILERFGIEEEVIKAMKAHHEDYEAESLEAILIKVADQISGARPGARKDTIENYLKRLKELEEIALSFPGVEKAYAIQAGRELRIFVKPEEVGDLESYKLAKDIANRIHQELTYPGEIKVNLIRETRVIEYAR